MLKSIRLWLKRNYFSGGYSVGYKVTNTQPWEILLKNFSEKELDIREKANCGILIGVNKDRITVRDEIIFRLRLSEETCYSIAEMIESEHGLLISIHIYLGSFLATFLSIWKGFVFIFTMIVLTGLLLSLHSWADLKVIVVLLMLLPFHLVCWVVTILLKEEAIKMRNIILRIAERP